VKQSSFVSMGQAESSLLQGYYGDAPQNDAASSPTSIVAEAGPSSCQQLQCIPSPPREEEEGEVEEDDDLSLAEVLEQQRLRSGAEEEEEEQIVMAHHLAECEHSFLEEFLSMLSRGVSVKKHGVGKRVRERIIKIADDEEVICWESHRRKKFLTTSSKSAASGDKDPPIRVRELVDVRRNTFVGKDIPQNVTPHHCLAVLTKDHTVLNLELPDEEVRDLCADGFALLYQKITLNPLPGQAPDDGEPPGVDTFSVV